MKPSSEVVWITGGGTGIGRALAVLLAQKGYRVAISGRREDLLQAVLTDHPALQAQLLAVPADVSRPESVKAAIEAIHRPWGQVDILVNNAGILISENFHDSTFEKFEESFRINCFSIFLTTKALLPDWLKRRKGMVVNISSILGKWASPSSPGYSSSKYAVAGLTDSIRQELRGTGIHVMGVYPGYIRTAMTEPYASPLKRHFGASPESMAKAIYHGMRRHSRDIYYPAYVPWVLSLHRWFPGLMERLRGLNK